MKLKLKEFKNLVSLDCGFKIDFRKHAYVVNEYGACPVVSYEEAEIILKSAYKVAEQYIIDNIDEESKRFFIWNFEIEMNKLKTSTIKSLFSEIVFNINHYENKKGI